MKYSKFYGIDGAKKATGVVIIIDILRAACRRFYSWIKGRKIIKAQKTTSGVV